MRKRILSLALALATVLVLLPASALAADSDFVIENGVLKRYNGPGGDVTIPSGVTSIGEGAFSGCYKVTSVNIPSGVTSIENAAFYGCNSLTSVNIPSGVTGIWPDAFYECYSLPSITLPDGMTWIGSQAFSGCENLTSITIPASMFYIGDFAFNACRNLTDVYYGGTEAQWRAIKIDYPEGNAAITKPESETGVKFHFNSTGSSTQPTTPAQPQQPAAETIASPTNDKLEVNGNAADPTVYKIGGSNYFKIRDVAALLNGTEKQFSVGYDGEKNAVTATTGQGYDKQSGDLAGAAKGGDQSAAASNDAIYVNGEKITAEVYKIGGSNYFKLRDLGKALNFYVGWSADRGMYIETDKSYSD